MLLAIDVGNTSTKIGLFTENDNEPVDVHCINTSKDESSENLVLVIEEFINNNHMNNRVWNVERVCGMDTFTMGSIYYKGEDLWWCRTW